MPRSTRKNPDAARTGGPGSSHQDRDHPGKKGQPHGHKGSGGRGQAAPGEATSGDQSGVSSGGGERDSHHTHQSRTKS